MSITRRDFVQGAVAAGIGLMAMRIASAEENGARPIKAIAFDAFPVFDPRPVFAAAEAMAPKLSEEWRTRQFEYTWLRTAAGKYMDFAAVTNDALVFAAKKLKVELSSQQREKLVGMYSELKPWPEVAAALAALKTAGYRLGFLSNFTAAMLQGSIRASKLDGQFDQIISTDAAKTYKPDPRAYQLGVDAFKLKKEEILFVAFAGWDAAGAKMFGYPTYWVNRLQQPPEELDATADASGKSLAELVNYLDAR